LSGGAEKRALEAAQNDLVGRAIGAIAMLGANFSAHENDIRNAETNRHQSKQRRDVRPDQAEALVDRQRRCQDSFRLAR
jgi:hypothetical protein